MTFISNYSAEYYLFTFLASSKTENNLACNSYVAR